jgi:NosR/NirI family transcriptional regulator, nitrous oxide reductase regulator
MNFLPSILAVTERFPAPDFKSGHSLPQTQTSAVTPAFWQVVDIVALTLALSLAAWFVFGKRSRKWVVGLTIASVLYFGFWRKGCVCPVGSIQNVAFAAGGHGYALPWVVAAYFLLPLLFTLFYGRVFCSGVCPLGAVQDLVLFKPVQVPRWVEAPLGILAWAYLGLAVLMAAVGSDFVICRYDPFVSFFRLSGPTHMLIIGAGLLVLSMFVGRVYCRFLCPYSVLLRLLAPFSRRQVSITPTQCTSCRLCEKACPFGAIRYPSKDKRASSSRFPALIGIPAMSLAFALLGYMSSGTMSRVDFTVRLADAVRHEQAANVKDSAEETKAFRGTGKQVEQLYEEAALIGHRFAVGTPIFGAFLGLVIGTRVFSRGGKGHDIYRADAASCVACTRCFAWCPSEVVREQEPPGTVESAEPELVHA